MESLVIPENGPETLRQIKDYKSLYVWGLVAFTIMVLLDLLLVWVLYRIFKERNRRLAYIASLFRGINVIFFFLALAQLYFIPNALEGNENRVMELYQQFDTLWLIGLMFFGVHLVLLGRLLQKESSHILGWVLMIAGIGYLVDSTAHFAMQDYSMYEDLFSVAVILPAVITEFYLTVWLLWKGFRRKEPKSVSKG